MKTHREFAYQVTAVALISIALVLLILAGFTGRAILLAIVAMPFTVVGAMFAAKYRRLRRVAGDGLSPAERAHPRNPGVDTGGAQTHGSAGAGFFGGV